MELHRLREALRAWRHLCDDRGYFLHHGDYSGAMNRHEYLCEAS